MTRKRAIDMKLAIKILSDKNKAIIAKEIPIEKVPNTKKSEWNIIT